MNIILLKNNLREGLSALSGVRTSGAKLPILKNFLLEAEDEKLTLSATDLEIGIQYTLSAKIIEKGSITVPFQTFSQMIQNIAFERINLETNDGVLLVTTDNYRASVSTTPKEDFPIMPHLEDVYTEFVLDAELCVEALSSVIGACQVSEIRPELSGILIVLKNNRLQMVATDSFRLAQKTISEKQFSTNATSDVSFIIPYRTAQEIVRIMGQEKGQVTMRFDSRQMVITTPAITMVSQLIEGTFPDYEGIIPKEFETQVQVEKEDIISALKLTSALSNRLNEVRFVVDSNKTITIFSSTQELGENEYVVPAKVEGDHTKVVFNWKFFLDGVRPLSSKNIIVGMNGEEKPSIIKSPEDTSFSYIIMPIKSS